MSKCLITGNLGFVGTYLQQYLETEGEEVMGFDIKNGQDFRDYEAIHTAIDYFRPDKIFHIGALAYIPESFIDPYRTFDANVLGSLNILESVKRIGLKTKIHLCGTSEEYGDAPGPVTEESLPNPLSPYAIAKLAMDQLGQLYARSYNMDIVVTRTFNHTGPGRGEQYAESAWAKQIAEIERGDRTTLWHGDLEPIRNYTDVRDVVRAYALAIDLPSGVYNICSDASITMEQVLTILRSFSKAEITTEVDINLMRPADFSFNEPSAKKFVELTRWKPEIPLHVTLRDILDYWRKAVI
jgi:GDP-4-dehydro-6-deoxy-D-mannose reductase